MVFSLQSNGFLPAPSGYEPTISWQREQTSEFSELRQRLGRHKTKLINQSTQTKPTLVSNEIIEYLNTRPTQVQ